MRNNERQGNGRGRRTERRAARLARGARPWQKADCACARTYRREIGAGGCAIARHQSSPMKQCVMTGRRRCIVQIYRWPRARPIPDSRRHGGVPETVRRDGAQHRFKPASWGSAGREKSRITSDDVPGEEHRGDRGRCSKPDDNVFAAL